MLEFTTVLPTLHNYHVLRYLSINQSINLSDILKWSRSKYYKSLHEPPLVR